ncbi:MAG: ABC transporter substrate-binding protein [Corallococcus sp.]|nr:ABC transporter substrate-binding protein [Bacillota bacterium]MCM1533379.1 ABC transporter substrate-binding protein [Corallococcus sp.]
MKNFSRKLSCVVLAVLLVLPLLTVFAGCKRTLDSETTPLVFSTEAVDGVFNPFSYTSGADGGIVGETQIGMLNIDKDGQIVSGWDQPTVAEAHSYQTTGTEADYDRDGDYSNFYTDYYFAIKDGIKFSDGTPLTIKDVLFNMYVYLDLVYTGSSTMYSVDIQGLQRYRTQSEADNAQENINNQATTLATQRLERLISWANDSSKPTLENYFSGDQLTEVKADIAKIKSLFREELNTDWTAADSAIEEYEKYYLQNDATDAILTSEEWAEYTKKGNTNKHISEQWEVFLIMYRLITVNSFRFDDGTKKYTFQYNGADAYDHSKDALIDRVYTDFFPQDETSDTFRNKLAEVLTLYNTSNTFFEYAQIDEKGKLINDGETRYKNISGITTYLADSIPDGNGGTINFDGERNILKIRINGVDPKAILSFSFTVAPMHYYSTPEAIAAFKELDDTTDEEGHTVKNYEGFGVVRADPDFMSHINTILVPRGAGAYRPSNGNISGTTDNAEVTITQFYNNNIINFERNNYFDTVMKNGHNAYIKFLRYKVISTNSMVSAVTASNPEVYVSTPNATKEILDEVRNLDGITAINVDNMGYGYIGINASYVKDLNVRRAIMHAMNVDLCRSYYQDDELVDIIYRSMSKNSWAYPKGATAYYEFDETGKTSLRLVKEAGYELNTRTGILTNADGETLKFTFTVAGETEDHPAYQTMTKAAQILNDIGFDITVTKDTQALSKLASGRLQVWAAAWSSSVDPDMYQVYHKDSTASSVKNWGYPYLLRDGTYEERDIIDRLAEQISLGRKYTEEADRKPYYTAALDLVMELAVELPTYQRTNMYVINTKVIDENTLCESTVHQSPVSQVWNIKFVGQD